MVSCGPPHWGLKAEQRCEVTVAGVVLDAFCDLDEAEIRRRQRLRASLTLDWRQLEAVATLPYLVAIPWLEVDLRTRLALDTLPGGVIEGDGDAVRRVWRPAVRVVAVQALGTRWQGGLHDVSMFAAVAPRILCLRAIPADLAALRARAAKLGVGAYVDERRPRALTDPPARRFVREDARRWEVAEAIYARGVVPTATSTSATASS